MKLRLETYSYRFAEQILNGRLSIKKEIEEALLDSKLMLENLSRPNFNKIIRDLLLPKEWEDQPSVFNEPKDPAARMDFLKDRVGVEVEFGHASFLGIDLLKFQTASFSGIDKIDIGVYIVTTRSFQKVMKKEFNMTWEGSLSFEKVVRYLPHFKSAIQVPIFVYGIDI